MSASPPQNPLPSQDTPKPEAAEKDNPWSTLGWGAFLVAVGVGLFFYFGHLEQEGGRVRMNAIVLLVYNFLGKWGVLGVFGGIGALMVLVGVKDLTKSKA